MEIQKPPLKKLKINNTKLNSINTKEMNVIADTIIIENNDIQSSTSKKVVKPKKEKKNCSK